ncbi:MAG: DUF3299 domain-containing protein [Micavibrio sp.]|nr:DUF3299 domain-containing protein [Micavibrio sp.]
MTGGAAVLLLLCLSWALHDNRWHAADRSDRQQVIDRIFGGAATFDPNAADILVAAGSEGDDLDWKTLSHVKLDETKGLAVSPHFKPDVLARAGKSAIITGYMFPLQGMEGQSHFLLSAYPPSCPYCLPGGPTEMIDVKAHEKIEFTNSPITLQGTLQVLQNSAETEDGFIYRLEDAGKAAK